MQTVKRPRRSPLLDGIRAEMAAVAVVGKRGREVEAEKRAGEAARADAGEKGEAMGEGGNGRVGWF